MMIKRLGILAGVALAVTPGVAFAGWKLVPQGKPAAVVETAMTVTPGEDWNRLSSKVIPKGEVWTLDGPALNELYLVSGLAAGETLYRDARKKDHPLPKLGTGLQLTDVPDFVESSLRVALDTTAFSIDKVEPRKLADHPGISFAFRYAVANSPLRRRGLASAALVNNQLSIIIFTAPELYYFDRDAARVQALMASAKF